MNVKFNGDAANSSPVSPLFFKLDARQEYIEITGTVSEKCIFMWYLYDPEGKLRAQSFCLGSGKTVAVTCGTGGYGTVPGPLPDGEWTIWAIFLPGKEKEQNDQVWTLNVSYGTQEYSEAAWSREPDGKPSFVWLDPEGNVCGEYLKRCYKPEKAWYKGDFHAHTTLSDGKMTPLRIQNEAGKQGLDFYAVTDHNFIHTAWTDDRMPVLPGMELTLDQGHFNLFMKGAFPLYKEGFWRNMTFESDAVNTFLIEARKTGAVVSVNHAFMVPWEVKYEGLDTSLIDAMEIICDPTWSNSAEAAEKALKAFGILWEHGVKVTGIGGSDIHNLPEEPYEGSHVPGKIGFPLSWVLADELSPAALLEALRERRVCVTTGFRLDIRVRYQGNDYTAGSCIPVEDESDISFSVSLQDTDQPYFIDIVESGAANRAELLNRENILDFKRNWDGGYHWLRIDIRDSSGRLCGFANPVYSGNRKIEKILWGNLVELIE